MKKKKSVLLASMICLALQTGNALAATPTPITPGTYDEYQELGGETKDDQVQISEKGEYIFKNGATIVNSDKNGRPTDIISNTNTNKDITITVGNEAEKTKLELISQAKPDDHSDPGSWFNIKNNIITNENGGNTNINLINSDIIFNGVYNAAVNADKINIQGDGNSNIYILGDMNTGLELTNAKNGESNIKGINDLKIISNKDYSLSIGAVQALQLMNGNTLNLEVKNLQIGNINDVKTLNFGTGLYVSGGNLKINADNINIGSVTNGIYAFGKNSNVDIDTNKEFSINAIDGLGISMMLGSNVDIKAESITINGIGPDNQEDGKALGQGIYDACGILNLKAKNDINIFGAAVGVELGAAGSVGDPDDQRNFGKADIISENGNINIISSQFVGLVGMIKPYQNFIRDVNIEAKQDINIAGVDKGIFYEPGSRNLTIKSTDKNINILSDNIGFLATNIERTGSVGTPGRVVRVGTGELRGYVNIETPKGDVSIIGKNSGLIIHNLDVKEYVKGSDGKVYFNDEGYFTTFNVNANNVTINGNNDYGIKAQNILANYAETAETAKTADRNSYVKINSNTDINIFGGKAGILSSLTRESFDVNNINNRKNTNLSSNINLMANGDITVQSNDYGIMAFENGNVNLHAKNGDVTVVSTDADVRKSSNIAAIYIESDDKTNSEVNIQSDNGIINILSNNKSVWVSGNGGELDVTGVVNINSKIYGNEEGQHIALVAGMKNSNTKDAFNKKGTVNINLTGDIDSFITGDVVGARNGIININRQSGDGRLVVKGDALAGNTGIVNLGVGNNGYFEGRTDDYQDAATKAETGNTFFDPHFTDGEVTERGQVNLDFGKNSVWKVTGQSWASTVKSDNALIDLTTAKSKKKNTKRLLKNSFLVFFFILI